MPRGKSPDKELLSAALEGLEAQKRRVEAQISQVETMLGRRRGRKPKAGPAEAPPAARKRKLSSAARKRIAAAQKRRWAEYRKRVAAE